MDAMVWTAAGVAALITAALFLLKNGRRLFARDPFARFERLVAEVSENNEAYFRSLDQMLNTLDVMRTRADEAERRLREMAARSADERREAAAALPDADEPSTTEAGVLNESRSRRKERQQVTETTETDETIAPVRVKRPRLVPGARNAGDFLSVDGKRVRLSGTAE